MPKYQNVGFESGKATFIDPAANTFGPNTAIFTNEAKKAPLAGGAKAAMVVGSLTVNQPTQVVAGEAVNPTVLNESLKLQWNFSRADTAKLAAMRTEMNRLLDEAIATYNLTKGLVPAVYATFETV